MIRMDNNTDTDEITWDAQARRKLGEMGSRRKRVMLERPSLEALVVAAIKADEPDEVIMALCRFASREEVRQIRVRHGLPPRRRGVRRSVEAVDPER